jgi:hypothetical protein
MKAFLDRDATFPFRHLLAPEYRQKGSTRHDLCLHRRLRFSLINGQSDQTQGQAFRSYLIRYSRDDLGQFTGVPLPQGTT